MTEPSVPSSLPGRRIRLTALSGSVVLADGRDTRLQAKRLLLLAYLLVEGREGPVRRDTILTLFWPDTDPERGRNAMRQALFALRTTLGAEVLVSRGANELSLDLTLLESDVLEFLDAVAAGDHERAATLYQAEFLAGMPAGESVELDHWLEEVRARFRRLAAQAVRQLAGRAATAPASRRELLERLLQIMPHDEDAAFEQVRTLLELGDRPGAVEAYRRFALRLQRDLELQPSPALTQLVEQARAGGSPAPDAPSRAADVGAPAPRRLRLQLWLAAIGAITVVAVLLATIPRRVPPDPLLVVIEPFEARAGDAEAGSVARIIEGRLRGLVSAVPGLDLRGSTDTASVSPSGARPGTVIEGGVLRRGPAWVVWASVRAQESGLILERIEEVGSDPDSLGAHLVDRLGATISTRRDMELQWGRTLHRPGSLATLEQYQRGFALVAQGDAEGGIAAFREAWASDSSFLIAGVMAANNLAAINQFDAARRLTDSLARREPRMLPLERHLWLRTRAVLAGDLTSVLRESRALTELEPRAPFLLTQHAQDATFANRPAEALRLVGRLPAGQSTSLDLGFSVVGPSLHRLGRFREELALVDRSIAAMPGVPHLFNLRIPPLAGLGEVDSIRAYIGSVRRDDPGRDLSRLYRGAGVELLAHGRRAEGIALLEEGAAWLEVQPWFPGRTQVQQLQATDLLNDAGRSARVLDVLQKIAASGQPLTASGRSLWLGAQGVAAARLGDTATARAAIASLDTMNLMKALGLDSYRRARIHAELGEPDAALRALAQAAQEGFISWREVHLDRSFERLREESRFKQLTAPRD